MCQFFLYIKLVRFAVEKPTKLLIWVHADSFVSAFKNTKIYLNKRFFFLYLLKVVHLKINTSRTR